MSEFKFSCPHCGQHLAAEEAWAGSQIECPTCHSRIIVPRMAPAASAVSAPPPLPAVAPPPPARHPAPAPALPQAPAQTRRGLAKWGLGLGYFLTLVGVAALGFFVYGKFTGKELNRSRFGRDGSASTGRTAAASAGAESSQPTPQDPPVTTDPQTMEVPATAASGMLFGKPFTVEKASYQGGVLQLAQRKGSLPDADLKVFLVLNAGEKLEGRTFIVSPRSSGQNPHVNISRQQSSPGAKSLVDKYALRLEFGNATGNKVPLKLYFEAPQSYETLVAGNAEVEIK